MEIGAGVVENNEFNFDEVEKMNADCQDGTLFKALCICVGKKTAETFKVMHHATKGKMLRSETIVLGSKIRKKMHLPSSWETGPS